MRKIVKKQKGKGVRFNYASILRLLIVPDHCLIGGGANYCVFYCTALPTSPPPPVNDENHKLVDVNTTTLDK